MLIPQCSVKHVLPHFRAQEGALRQIADIHFKKKLKQRFPREGTTATPPHPANDFKWKDYCPAVFRKLREVFGVNDSDYMLSVCGKPPGVAFGH